MNILQRIDQWRQTKTGLIVYLIVGGLLFLLFATLAIDTGSLLDYFIAILLLIFVVQDATALFKIYAKKRLGKMATKKPSSKSKDSKNG